MRSVINVRNARIVRGRRYKKGKKGSMYVIGSIYMIDDDRVLIEYINDSIFANGMNGSIDGNGTIDGRGKKGSIGVIFGVQF
jgi:hypothetical protein